MANRHEGGTYQNNPAGNKTLEIITNDQLSSSSPSAADTLGHAALGISVTYKESTSLQVQYPPSSHHPHLSIISYIFRNAISSIQIAGRTPP
jgi:hypothetical protein